MHQHRVFIVGDSIYAEGITHTLLNKETVVLVGIAPSVEVALSLVYTAQPDVIIVTGANEDSANLVGPLMARYPQIPIIRADLSINQIQIIISQCFNASIADLLAAITALPTQHERVGLFCVCSGKCRRAQE